MPVAKPASPSSLSDSRLPFLDGIRGLAALYVTLHHAALMIPPVGLPGPLLVLRFFLRHGHGAVAVFIVLSGYCLMLPMTSQPSGHARVDFRTFLKRRSRRILPPYLGTLLLCWVLIALIPALGRAGRTPWDRALPAFDRGVITSHLLLVHNLNERWIYKIDPPLWSVATEWQIYLLFPILVGVWRRGGIVAMIAAGFSIGYAIAALAIPLKNPALRDLCPWFVGLFTLGMTASLAGHKKGSIRECGREACGPLAIGMCLLTLLFSGLAIAGTSDRNFMLTDPVVGAAMACLLVHWTRRALPGGTRSRLPILRLLEGRPAVALGTISYSLYLVHYPLLALGDVAMRRWHLGPGARLSILIGLASPVILFVATLFHRIFERPFLIRSQHPTGDAVAPFQIGLTTSEESTSITSDKGRLLRDLGSVTSTTRT